ncbi:hypothetical protein ACRAWD_24110 [Caulobacter segnis]
MLGLDFRKDAEAIKRRTGYMTQKFSHSTRTCRSRRTSTSSRGSMSWTAAASGCATAWTAWA